MENETTHRYSIVLPTLWKSKRIHVLLSDLLNSEYVHEIILIDNSNSFFVYYETIPNKVVLIQPDNNIYVNPAWNLGIEKSKNNCIALVNDDVNFDISIFKTIDYKILSEFGIIGQDMNNYKYLGNEHPTIRKYSGEVRDWGWGCLIFLNKNSWVNIPDNIKIWYGDDFIFKHNPIIKSKICNFSIYTEMSTTSDDVVWDNIKKNDYSNFIKLS